jgi:hypothetical protein
MKKYLLRAAMIASLCLLAAGTVMAPQAFADSSKAPTVSAAVAKPLQAAHKALQDKDWATALAKLKEAQAVGNLNDYDQYLINYFTGIAQYNLNDVADAAAAFVAAVESPAAPVDQRKDVFHDAIGLEEQLGNWPKVLELAKVAQDNNLVDDNIANVIAVAYLNNNDCATAQTWAQKSIALSTAASKVPARNVYEVILQCQIKQKDVTGEIKTVEMTSNLYGTPNDWGNLLNVSTDMLATANKANHELAALSLFRLRLATMAETKGADWLWGAELAMGMGLDSPGDAQQMLNAGLKNGTLSQAQAAGPLAKASAKARGDEATLAVAEKAASKEANGNGATSVAEAYYGYGRYADAERVATLAISKGGPKMLEAKLLLGCAQAMQGEDAAATQTFSLVKGDPALERAAYLWTLYTTRKYGQPAATPAPAAH